MISGIHSSASALQALQTKQAVSANNVANASTPGFQAASTSLSETAAGGVSVASTPSSQEQGPLQQTGFASDVAIQGKGFFAVADDAGKTSYTRSGNFVPDSQGFLRTPGGQALQGEDGAVQLPAGSTLTGVARDGTVQARDAQGNSVAAGRVTLSTFANEQGLQKQGDGTLSPTAYSGSAQTSAPGTGGTGSVVSGALEVSNTDYAEESVNSIITARSFEANVVALRTSDEMMRTAAGML